MQNNECQNTLNNLLLELKLEVILNLSNPSPLAKCSREWYNLINSPYVKSKWLVRTYSQTHALIHAIRLGEPFSDSTTIRYLLAQKANLSRYAVQKLKAGFEHQRPWGSHLADDIYEIIVAEGIKLYGEGAWLHGNDMELFYSLAGRQSTLREARGSMKENLGNIRHLIRACKFAPFPLRPGSGLLAYPSALENDPAMDGYENVSQWNIVVRAILLCPDLVNEWKRIGYTNVVSDVNSLVIQGLLQILFPKTTGNNWVQPIAAAIVKRFDILISLGFYVGDGVIGDGLLMFGAKVVEVGDTVIKAFAAVRGLTTEQVLEICLEEILKPERELKEHYLLDFIVNRVADPETKIFSIFRKYGIIIEHDQIPLSRTFLKYPAPIYRFIVIKFGVRSRIAKYLMRELLVGSVGISQQPASVAHTKKWRDLVIIFNEYYNIDVPFEPEDLSIFRVCSNGFIMQTLFEGYLPKLFGYEGNREAVLTLRPAVLMPVIPLPQASLKRRKGAKKAKMDLQKQWVEACSRQLQDEDLGNDIFRNALQKFLQHARELLKPEQKSKRARLR